MQRIYLLAIPLTFLLLSNIYAQVNNLDGSFEIYTTSGNNLDELAYFGFEFMETVSSVTQIRYNNTFFLFFYDRTNGTALLLDSELTIARSYYDLSRSWYRIIAHDFDSDGKDELLLYDQYNGTAEICNLGKYLELIVQSKITSIRKTWTEIVLMDSYRETRNEFLFYDAKDSIANLYKITKNNSGDYKIDSLWGSVFMKRQTWETIKRITFENGTKGIITYDPFNKNQGGQVSLFRYNSSAPYFTDIPINTEFPKNITYIETGDFGDGREYGNLLFYVRESGDCRFYKTGNENLIIGDIDSSWRNSWNIILPIKTGLSNDLILFYETDNNRDLIVKTYDGTNQAIHPDVIIGHDGKYKMVMTPFPFSDDDFENPSVLESVDGFNFTEIPGTRRPLINMPTVPPNYRNAYNNDPDVLYDNRKYFMVYNETFSQKHEKFYQNVKMVMYDSNFSNPDSITILKQTSYQRMTFAPSLIKANKYYMFFVGKTPDSKFEVSYLSNIELMKGWDQQIKQRVIFNTSKSFQPWHINVLRNNFDGMYYMLIAGKYDVASSKNNDLYIARSKDLIKWDLAPEPLMRKENYGHAQIYRSTGIFEDKNNLTLWYSYFESNDQTGMGIRKSIYIDTSIFSGGQQPKKKDLVQLAAYPNPFNTTTRINFNLPINGYITLKVYDVLGREVKNLISNDLRPAGNYTSYFNGKNYASGIYYCMLFIDGDNDYTSVYRIVLLK